MRCESSFDADAQRVVDLRQRLGREPDVDDVAEHLNDFSGSQPFLYPYVAVRSCANS